MHCALHDLGDRGLPRDTTLGVLRVGEREAKVGG